MSYGRMAEGRYPPKGSIVIEVTRPLFGGQQLIEKGMHEKYTHFTSPLPLVFQSVDEAKAVMATLPRGPEYKVGRM